MGFSLTRAWSPWENKEFLKEPDGRMAGWEKVLAGEGKKVLAGPLP